MSFLTQFFEGSLVSRERLMQAREFYAPFRRETSAQTAFARWAERISLQSELGAARELSGLSDEELAELEAEFVRCPMRPQAPWVRHAMVSGAVLTAIAGLGLGLAAVANLGASETRVVQTTGIGCLFAGLAFLASALVSAFGNVHAALSHGTTGLYVGTLDEQHPWLGTAVALTRHHIAESYRLRTLASRGRLRGADVVMMRELVASQEALQRVRPSRALAEQLQFLPSPPVEALAEPRLVHVGAARDLRQATAGRPFALDEPRAAAN